MRVAGDLDQFTYPVVRDTLVEAMSREPRHLVVDLAQTTFCGVAGYALLAETATSADTRGVEFAVSGLSTHQDRVFSIVSIGRDLIRYRSVAAAVTTAVRADLPHPLDIAGR